MSNDEQARAERARDGADFSLEPSAAGDGGRGGREPRTVRDVLMSWVRGQDEVPQQVLQDLEGQRGPLDRPAPGARPEPAARTVRRDPEPRTAEPDEGYEPEI